MTRPGTDYVVIAAKAHRHQDGLRRQNERLYPSRLPPRSPWRKKIHDTGQSTRVQARLRLTDQPIAACLLDRRRQRRRQDHDRARLADKHGLRLYSTDEATGDHARRWLPEDCPNLAEFVEMSMDQRWVDRSPQTMLETFHWFRGEGFGLIIEDLLALPLG